MRLRRGQLLVLEVGAGLAIVALLWLDEILDLPHLWMGAPATPINWRESLLETLVVVPIFALLAATTHALLDRLKTLEGLLSVCAHCRRIRTEERTWVSIEEFLHERAPVDFSHGICPDCLERHFPEVAARHRGKEPNESV